MVPWSSTSMSRGRIVFIGVPCCARGAGNAEKAGQNRRVSRRKMVGSVLGKSQVAEALGGAFGSSRVRLRLYFLRVVFLVPPSFTGSIPRSFNQFSIAFDT